MEKQIGFDERTYKLPKYTKSSGKISIHGRLLSSYILHLIASIVLEALFIWGQYYLYGLTLDTRYICHRFPCPHKVDCFLSRPTEKSIFIWFMLVAAIISLLLCLIEFFYMCFKVVKECVSRRQDYTVTPVTPPLKAYKSHDEMIQNSELKGPLQLAIRPHTHTPRPISKSSTDPQCLSQSSRRDGRVGVRCGGSRSHSRKFTSPENPASLTGPRWTNSEDPLKQNKINLEMESNQSIGGSLDGAKEEKRLLGGH
uniref:Gap junction protein n=1 Tax=Knipowitschia caucasica TaxID=637954 RepID=A0AAV2KA68_KNICA